MIQIAPIEDMELVRATLTQPHIWDAFSDDLQGDPLNFDPCIIPGALWLGAWDGPEYLGLFPAYRVNGIMCEVHVAMIKHCGGSRALRAYRAMRDWIWANTGFKRIITSVPDCNKLGLRYALLAGLSEFGLNPGGWLKNGQLHDLHLLGVSHG